MVSFRWHPSELPRIAVGGRFPHFDQSHTRAHKSPTHALHLYDYAASMRFETDEVALEPGDLTLSPAGRRTTYDMTRPGFHLCLHFWPGAMHGRAGSQIPIHVRLGPRRESVRDRILEIVRLQARAEEPLMAARAGALLLELLLSLATTERPPEQVRHGSEFAVEAAAAWLDTHPAEEVSAAALARRVGLSQNYLARRFRERFGRTLPAYFLARRIELARQMLLATELSIKEVAARVGFSDAQYFNKQFRRFSAESPSTYRERLRVPVPRRGVHGST